jgi:hypothetical protein
MVSDGVLEHSSLHLIRDKLRHSNFYLTEQLLDELR